MRVSRLQAPAGQGKAGLLLGWHLAFALGDVLPFRPQPPSPLERSWLQLLGRQSQT